MSVKQLMNSYKVDMVSERYVSSWWFQHGKHSEMVWNFITSIDYGGMGNDNGKVRQMDTLIEKYLGINWKVKDDKFGFDIHLKEKPFTRRGLLLAIS